MAIPDLSHDNLPYHRERIEALTPSTERRWGEMTVERMMLHLRTSIHLMLDDPEGKVKILAPPVIRTLITWLFFDLLTRWPKGRMKAIPLYLPESTLPFEEEKRLLLEVCQEFAERCKANPDAKHVHPLAGTVPLRRLAHLHGVHMNHHYRQFGLV